MDEVREFCVRVLGPGPAANDAVQEVRRTSSDGRVQALAAASRACRTRADGAEPAPAQPDAAESTLAAAVARELAVANAALPERQREALALRELLGLSYEEIAQVIGIEAAAVGPLLARARLSLRAELRGSAPEQSDCPDRDRSLRVLARRQDSEPAAEGDEAWLLEHLGTCRDCSQTHAAMLEASACYRAWE
jgi:hypothetical protein